MQEMKETVTDYWDPVTKVVEDFVGLWILGFVDTQHWHGFLGD
jgi:hypothetical protein